MIKNNSKYAFKVLCIFILGFSILKCSVKLEEKIAVTSISNGKDLSFPIISSSNKMVQDKINATLQLTELGLLKGKEKSNIFEERTKPSKYYDTLHSFQYKVLSNSKNNLSILILKYACRMTCMTSMNYYNFNPQNGSRYFIMDFFKDSNIIKFINILIPIRKNHLNQQIDQLKEKDEIKTHLKSYIGSQIENDDLEDFYFTGDSLYFNIFNNVNSSDRFYPLNYTTSIAISKIAHLINDYGISALRTGENLYTFKGASEPQLYEGLIGNKIPLYFMFHNYGGNEFFGYYTIKEKGISHRVFGKYINGEFRFVEVLPLEEFDKINFIKNDLTLEGTFIGNDGEKFSIKMER